MKLYHRRTDRGVKGYGWRLRLDFLARSQTVIPNQRAALIITVRDPQGEALVYAVVSQFNLADASGQCGHTGPKRQRG